MEHKQKYDVFISYSRKDTTIANKICNALDKKGISYFIDRQGIGGGQEFPEVLADAIIRCRIMLYLASANSYNSKFTNSEITFAFNEKPKGSILPYILDGSRLPATQRFIFAGVNIRTLEEHPIDTILIQDLCQLLDSKETEEAKRKAEEAKIRTEEENKQIIENQTKNSTSSKTSNLQPQITTQNTIFTDPGVQNHLGDDFYYGENEQKQSYSEAVKWYRKAAKQGHSQAQFNLGRCYESGKGVQQNDEEAAKWYRKAAEQGHEEAQCDLGLCYEEGRGVAQDYVEAVKWYQRAAKQGNDYAQLFLASCYKEGTGVAQDYEEAVKWYRKAIEQGNVCAQCDLGLCYEEGTGVAQDYKEATKWYLKSAEQGYDNAQFHLALCYEKGRGVSRNYMKAKEWCNKAAQQGHEDAIEWLENMKKMGY